MRPFDEYMERWCGERGIRYTRYCDDMTFSGDFDVSQVRRKVCGYLRIMGFEPNRKKTRVLTCGSRQIVTGIVVNWKPQVPREYRRKVRQELYYCRKYGVEEHLKRSGALKLRPDSPDVSGMWNTPDNWSAQDCVRRYLEALLGRINFILMANPEDTWFCEAKEEVRKALKSGSEEFGS